MKSYKDLEIYQLSFNLFIELHRFTLTLPKYETYELGSQLRRAADSINSNIVEGYGRNRYRGDFIRFLTYSLGSNDEVINHLRKVYFVYPKYRDEARELGERYVSLGKRLRRFIDYVEKNWNKSRNERTQAKPV